MSHSRSRDDVAPRSDERSDTSQVWTIYDVWPWSHLYRFATTLVTTPSTIQAILSSNYPMTSDPSSQLINPPQQPLQMPIRRPRLALRLRMRARKRLCPHQTPLIMPYPDLTLRLSIPALLMAGIKRSLVFQVRDIYNHGFGRLRLEAELVVPRLHHRQSLGILYWLKEPTIF